MKLSSAPESTNTGSGSHSRDHWRDAGRMIRAVGLGKEVVWLTSLTIFTGKPDLLVEPDRWRYGVWADQSRCKDVG